mgnify:CR=1 FL=1
MPGGGICLSDRGAAGSERFHGISVQLLCGWRAAGVRRAAWKGGLWLALPVRTDTGTDTQDPIAQTKVKENISVSQISGPCRVCLRAPGHSDQLYGHGKTGFLCVPSSGIPLLGTHEELRRTIGALFSLKMAILIVTVAGCIFIYRFFCRTLCPLGAIYGIMNKISLCHLEVDKDRCINCGKCKSICKMEVDPVREPDSAECIRCGACAHACPKSAIYVGMTKYREQKASGGDMVSDQKKNMN